MIDIKVLGMYSSDFSGSETRNGDTQIVTDGKYYDVIDGGCDRYATRLIAHLKANNIRDPYLHISHCHYDHRDGIDKILSDPWFKPRGLCCQDPDSITGHSSAIRSDINALRKIIDKAKSKGIPVIYLGNEDAIEHGEIKITVYRQYPKYSGNSDAYLNDGSLCYWFAELRYLTTGDASMWCAYKYNLNPLIVKGGHHGNDMSADGYLKPSQMCPWLYKHGCRYYWDNDFSTRLTDFLMTGREDAINADMTFIDIHGDIDMEFARGKVTITHAGKTYSDAVPYNGDYIPGWIKNSTGWWYRNADGSWPADCTIDLPWSQGVSTFCFDSRGYMVTGWRKIEGKWYYFDENGAMVTGWRKINGKWYYLSRWESGESGAMVTGWQKLDGKMYYFDSSGAMVTDWQKIGDKWYYFSAGGAMQTGWIVWKDAWFYLDPTDGHMHTGWLDYKNKRCYLDGSGRALCDCIRVIDGKTYRFDAGCYATEVQSGTATSGRPDIKQNSGFRGYNVSRRSDPIMYIVVHYTGAEGTAKNNVDYFNGGNRSASADFFVGHDGEIWQYNPDIEHQYSWHCGGGRQSSKGGAFYGKCKNANSIGVELCTHKTGGEWIFYDATIEAAKRLVKYLMDTYNIKQKNVIRHYDVNGKNCPAVYGFSGDNAPKWQKFKASLSEQTAYDDPPQIYRVRKSWTAADTQVGAFAILENAKACAHNWGSEYHVFDKDGNMIE